MNGRNLALLVLAAGIAVLPLLLPGERDFGGADDRGSSAVRALAPEYHPWFRPFWTPPGDEVESLLFSLQAAAGAGLVGYYLGFRRGRQRHNEDSPRAGD